MIEVWRIAIINGRIDGQTHMNLEFFFNEISDKVSNMRLSVNTVINGMIQELFIKWNIDGIKLSFKICKNMKGNWKESIRYDENIR